MTEPRTTPCAATPTAATYPPTTHEKQTSTTTLATAA